MRSANPPPLDRRRARRSVATPGTIVVLLAAWILAPMVAAQDGGARREPSADDVEAVEQGRDALRGAGNAPWYDRDRDALRPIAIAPRSDDKGSRGTWEYIPPETPDDPTAPVTTTTTGSGLGSGLTDLLGWMVYVIAYGALALAIGVILYFGYRYLFSFQEEEITSGLSDAEGKKSTLAPDRVEELPFEVQATKGDLLDEARRCFAAGDFDRAIVYLYAYQLVQLDKRQFIELSKGKTNRQYLSELRPKADMRRMMEETVLAFEDVFFGRHRLERPRFDRIWSGLDGFHRMLETPA